MPKEMFRSKDIDEIQDYLKTVGDYNNLTIDSVEVSILESSDDNEYSQRIIRTINGYLINNFGAAIDFHIIKEIVTGNIDTEESSIETRLPAPLYTGLAATMCGIIVGLFFVDFNTTEIDAIQPLIDGVKIAMIASLIGLGLTTYLSVWKFKNAKSSVDEQKNDFISLIQTELLPAIMGPGQSGMHALAGKLDDFGRSTGVAVNRLSRVVENSKDQVLASQQVIKQIEAIDLSNVAGANAKVFNSLSSMMDSFNSFPAYYKDLNKSLGKTTNLVTQLDTLVKNSQHIDEALAELKNVIKAGNFATEFFTKHIESFENYKLAVNKATLEATEAMKLALASMQEEFASQTKGIEEVVIEYEENIHHAFDKSIESFNTVVLEQVLKIQEAFKDSSPKFEKLEELTSINAGINRFNSDFAPRMIESQKSIQMALKSLAKSMASMNGGSNEDLEELLRSDNQSSSKSQWLDLAIKVSVLVASVSITSFGVHSLYVYWFK
ncbi:MAG: hypothetical protein HWE24_16710 [Oceanospirillaceae bacterium]|nr:hypothetical protein [Oceanospirillaceae bacterium]